MDWAQILPLAAAATATAMSGGAAAPALAGTVGAVEGAGAAGLGAAEAAGAAAASGATAAGTGAATPSGWAGIMEPMAGSSTPGIGTMPGQLGSGMSGAANPMASPGSLSGTLPGIPAPGTPPGMIAPPTNGAWPALQDPALGTGMSGTGSFATAPGSGQFTPAATVPQTPSLTPQQANALNNLMNEQPQQQRAAPGGATPPAQNNSNLKMASVNTPDLGARPSLAQLLYGRR